MSNSPSSPGPDAEQVDTEYDWSETSPSKAVIQSVAIAANTDSIDLDTLYGAIDIDAINSLMEREKQDSITVTFNYSGFRVEITNLGGLTVRSQDGVE